MQNLLEEAVDSSFDEGVRCERERVCDLLQLLQPTTIALVTEAIQTGKEATQIFAQAIELTTKARSEETAPEESLLRSQCSVMRRAFNRASSRVNGQQRGAFAANRVASPESAS